MLNRIRECYNKCFKVPKFKPILDENRLVYSNGVETITTKDDIFILLTKRLNLEFETYTKIYNIWYSKIENTEITAVNKYNRVIKVKLNAHVTSSYIKVEIEREKDDWNVSMDKDVVNYIDSFLLTKLLEAYVESKFEIRSNK